MSKYKDLAMNTMILAIGTFGSKILAFFLTRLYSTHMSADILGNKELIETLADEFGLAKSSVVFKSGETSKQKRILLRGISAAQAEERLKAVLGGKQNFFSSPLTGAVVL